MARSIHQSGFLLNWQCLGFKQIKYQLMWNSITKTWDFSFMKIENWNSFMPKMCIQIPWTMLCFYLGIEHLSFHTPVFPFLRRHMKCISRLPAPAEDTTAYPIPRACQFCSKTWFLLAFFFTYFTFCAWLGVCKCCSHTVQFAFVFLLVPLLTAHVA